MLLHSGYWNYKPVHEEDQLNVTVNLNTIPACRVKSMSLWKYDAISVGIYGFQQRKSEAYFCILWAQNLNQAINHPNWYPVNRKKTKTEICGLHFPTVLSIRVTTPYWKSCWLLVSHFYTVNTAPVLIPSEPKMATMCLLIGHMEAIKFSVVIRGHGYKFFTGSLVPFAGHRRLYTT